MTATDKTIKLWKKEFPSLEGKTALITGGNRGIGKATAVGLAALGARIVIVSRDAGHGETAREEIAQLTGNERVTMLACDFNSLENVRQLAQRYKALDWPLHILINNAGIMAFKRQLTADGHESNFGINYLAHFLLTQELTGILTASAPARIINVSSSLHHKGRLDLDDLSIEDGYSGMDAYGRSKLAQILHASELARRLASAGVTANSVHPGVVATDIMRSSRGVMGLIVKTFSRRFLRTNEQGADTVVYLAAADKVADDSGYFWANRRKTRVSKAAADAELAARLWQVSLDLTNLPVTA